MSTQKPWNTDPHVIYLGILILQFFGLFYLITPISDPVVFLILLATAMSMVLRWRIDMKADYMLVDTALIILAGFYYAQVSIFLIVTAYYFAYKNKLLYLLPIVGVCLFLQDLMFLVLLVQAVLFGMLLYRWSKDQAKGNETTDDLRSKIYELEMTQAHLLADYQDAEKLTRLMERQRIAEMLHDDLGHELTATQLLLRAYKTLLESGQTEKAAELLVKIEQKLDHSLTQLKETVKHIEPTLKIGFHDLKQMLDDYSHPIHFTHTGPIQKMKPYMWQLTLMSVKEALTNITKHANPKRINVDLEITDFIVRIVLENDGIKTGSPAVYGNGLRYMRNRLEAVNGSLSVQRRETFQLIIIMPFETGR